MSSWSLKHLTTFGFNAEEDETEREPTLYNAWGWPVESDRCCHRVTFTSDSSQGAFLLSPRVVILFQLSDSKSGVKPRSEIRIRCKDAVSTMAFGPKRGVAFICRNISSTNQQEFILATGHVQGAIRLWDATSSQLITQLISHNRRVTELFFSPKTNSDLQLLSVSVDKTLKVWDFESNGYNMCQTTVHSHPLLCLAWASGGHLVATGGTSRLIHVYNMGNQVKEVLHVLKGHLSCIVACKFSPDGALLVSASTDTRVNVWDSLTGVIRQALCHAYPIPQLIFGRSQVQSFDIDPFHTSIVTFADDTKLRIWDPLKLSYPDAEMLQQPLSDVPFAAISNPEFIVDLKEEDGNHSCIFSKGGRWIAVASTDSDKLVIYELDIGVPKLIHLCRMVVRRAIGFRPNGIEKLYLPKSIKAYLNYEL